MTRTCLDCGIGLRPQRSTPQPGTRERGGRGLCNTCYGRHRDHGTLIDYERTRRPCGDTLADWRFLRAAGWSRPDIAARLGIKDQSLYTALWRAKRRGLEVSA